MIVGSAAMMVLLIEEPERPELTAHLLEPDRTLLLTGNWL